jgi:preprotein translocase SecF subunit
MFQLLIGTQIEFMRRRRIAYVLSGGLVLATAIWLVVHGGPHYSVDFTGGTLLQIRTSRIVPADQVRQALDGAGYHGVELQQMTGEHQDEYLLRVKTESERDLFAGVQAGIQERVPGVTVDLRRTEHVGPKVGSELRGKAIWAILGSLAGILLYVGIRYQFKYAFGAVIALFHDLFVTLDMLCFTGREVSLTVVAALPTIAGFRSPDWIRALQGVAGRSTRVMDIAVNETLSRTVITSSRCPHRPAPPIRGKRCCATSRSRCW